MHSLRSRRNCQRYEVKEGTFAVLFEEFSKIRHLVDISMKGFSFRYYPSPLIDNDRDGKASFYPFLGNPLEGICSFDLFLADSGLFLDRIPCRIITDFEIDQNDLSISFPIKRCGLEFHNLRPDQISALERFIRQCAKPSIL